MTPYAICMLVLALVLRTSIVPALGLDTKAMTDIDWTGWEEAKQVLTKR